MEVYPHYQWRIDPNNTVVIRRTVFPAQLWKAAIGEGNIRYVAAVLLVLFFMGLAPALGQAMSSHAFWQIFTTWYGIAAVALVLVSVAMVYIKRPPDIVFDADRKEMRIGGDTRIPFDELPTIETYVHQVDPLPDAPPWKLRAHRPPRERSEVYLRLGRERVVLADRIDNARAEELADQLRTVTAME